MSKRLIATITAVAVVAGAAILCASRWNAWFGQPDESPYLPLSQPSRLMLTFGDNGELSRNVSWQCDTVLQDAWLDLVQLGDSGQVADSLRLPAQGEIFKSRAGKAAYYVARMDSLRPGAHYRYRSVTGAEASPWHEFGTLPLGKRNLSFLFVGDVQDTINGCANELLRQALARHPQAEFLVAGGDLTERPRDADWAETFRALDSICTAMPVMAITGNHDYLKGVISKLERRFSLVFSYYLNSMIGENQVYSLRYGPAEFFLLDSFREFPYLYTQRKWLKQRLEQSDAQWKIVVMHHPIYSMRGKNNLTQRWAFADVIEDGGVDLVLQGHEHNYARKSTDGGAPVFTISHCSPKCYSHKDVSQFDVVDFDSRYYQMVDIKGDTLLMRAYRAMDHSLVDSVRMVK